MRTNSDATPPSPLRRRLTLFRNSTSSPLAHPETEDRTEPESPRLRKNDRTSSWLSQISTKSQENGIDEDIRKRPGRLWIPSRNSGLGLSRSYEERTTLPLSATSSPTTSAALGESLGLDPGQVIYHGEVHTSSGSQRRSREYFVLTDHYLFRFKSQEKALGALRQ